MCLKALGREVEHAEAVHNLKVEASQLQIDYRRRLRQQIAEARERARASAERRAAQKEEAKAKQIEEHIALEGDAAEEHASPKAENAEQEQSPVIPVPTAKRPAA